MLACSSSLLPPSLSTTSPLSPPPPPHTLLSHHHRRRRQLHLRRRHLPLSDAALVGRGRRAAADRLLAGAAAGDGGAGEASSPGVKSSSTGGTSGDAYLGLFVSMLGLDNDPLDREHAIVTLWQYSQGGRKCIDEIMQFPGCINLVISLLKSESMSSREAAAGLLHNVTSIKLYRDAVAESGAMEEISSLLCQSTITPEIKERCLCTMWNLSIDEEKRLKIAKSDFIIKLVKFLDDEETSVKEAAGGTIANLALSPCNHGILVEASVIPQLANLLKNKEEGYKIVRKEARSALLKLCSDDYFRILVTEEGLVRVPLVGSAAYKAFRPVARSWPSLPDGTEIQRSSRPSRYGASELLLGLSVQERNVELEEAKINAMVGRSHQQFLVRVKAIEVEDGENEQTGSSQNDQYTLLPWVDGVARLVLILELADVSAIAKAAYAVADASISEHMRILFKEAGAVRQLVQLLHHSNGTVREAAVHALDKLSASSIVCKTIQAEGALELLVNTLKDPNVPVILLEKTINILSRIFDTGSNMKVMSDDNALAGSKDVLNAMSNSQGAIYGGLRRTAHTLSNQEEMTRESIVDFGVISRLTEILKEASPSLQITVASVLEHLAASDQHATAMTAARIGPVLEAVFETGAIHGARDDFDNLSDFTIVEIEEVSQAMSTAARLLTKLLNFDLFLRSINSEKFVVLLRRILKSNFPLQSKDWVAACLVKLEAKVGSAANGAFDSVVVEVTMYETIPRLVEQMMTSFSYEVKREAVIELNKIISGGMMEYTRAVATAGGIFPLVKMVEEGNDDALEASLAVLYNLSMDPENHTAIIAAGAVPVLKRIVLAEGPHWARALRLLRTLPT